eukprot:scaffold7092_cov262-Pinguiococcus_pyrenoidosus.AAC.5
MLSRLSLFLLRLPPLVGCSGGRRSALCPLLAAVDVVFGVGRVFRDLHILDLRQQLHWGSPSIAWVSRSAQCLYETHLSQLLLRTSARLRSFLLLKALRPRRRLNLESRCDETWMPEMSPRVLTGAERRTPRCRSLRSRSSMLSRS